MGVEGSSGLHINVFQTSCTRSCAMLSLCLFGPCCRSSKMITLPALWEEPYGYEAVIRSISKHVQFLYRFSWAAELHGRWFNNHPGQTVVDRLELVVLLLWMGSSRIYVIECVWWNLHHFLSFMHIIIGTTCSFYFANITISNIYSIASQSWWMFSGTANDWWRTTLFGWGETTELGSSSSPVFAWDWEHSTSCSQHFHRKCYDY